MGLLHCTRVEPPGTIECPSRLILGLPRAIRKVTIPPPPLLRACAVSTTNVRAPAQTTSGAARVYLATRAGVWRARRGRARRTGEMLTRVSLRRRMRERAAPPLRYCAVSTTNVRAPAKSTSAVARVETRARESGARCPPPRRRGQNVLLKCGRRYLPPVVHLTAAS
jgi:hypothetical protein